MFYSWRINRLVKKLLWFDIKLAIAESCTGGMLASYITNISGSSKLLDSSLVTYSNQAKQNLLDVKAATLKKYGAVSAETAKEMLLGVKKARRVEYAIAITGIAGPRSDDTKKPVGLVYIGVLTKKQNVIKEYNFSGTRKQIRKQACLAALKLFRKAL